MGLTLLAPIAWGTTYVTITELLPPDRPLLVATMRVLPAGLLLVLIGMLRGERRPRGRQWIPTLALSLFNFGLFFPLLIVAVYRMPGGVAAAIGGVQPIAVALITWLVAGIVPRRADIGLGLVAAAGVALVVLRPGTTFDAVGIAAALGANLSFATGVVLTKRFGATRDRVASAGWQLLASAPIVMTLSLVVEGAPPAFSARNLVGFGYLSLAATGLAFLIWFRGIGTLPTQLPPLLGLAAPLTGAAIGWIALGESMTTTQMIGFGVSLGAVGYGALRRTAEGRETDRRAINRRSSSLANPDCLGRPAPTTG